MTIEKKVSHSPENMGMGQAISKKTAAEKFRNPTGLHKNCLQIWPKQADQIHLDMALKCILFFNGTSGGDNRPDIKNA